MGGPSCAGPFHRTEWTGDTKTGRGYVCGVTLTFGDLVDDAEWVPMDLDQQEITSYFWKDGGLLRDAPVDFRATFDGQCG